MIGVRPQRPAPEGWPGLSARRQKFAREANARGIRPWLFKILHNVLNTRLSQEHRERELKEGLQHEPAHGPTDLDPYER